MPIEISFSSCLYWASTQRCATTCQSTQVSRHSTIDKYVWFFSSSTTPVGGVDERSLRYDSNHGDGCVGSLDGVRRAAAQPTPVKFGWNARGVGVSFPHATFRTIVAAPMPPRLRCFVGVNRPRLTLAFFKRGDRVRWLDQRGVRSAIVLVPWWRCGRTVANFVAAP
jgi:hypothetical protein